MLKGAGREGSLDGRILATLASRVTDIEEAGTQAAALYHELLPDDILEMARIHGCGMCAEANEEQPMGSLAAKVS